MAVDEVLEVRDAARELGITGRELYGLVEDGRLELRRAGGRWRVPRTSLDAYRAR